MITIAVVGVAGAGVCLIPALMQLLAPDGPAHPIEAAELAARAIAPAAAREMPPAAVFALEARALGPMPPARDCPGRLYADWPLAGSPRDGRAA